MVRQQAKSVLAGQNLNSKPVKDTQISIEQVIQKQIEKRQMADILQESSPISNFQHFPPGKTASNYMPTTPDFRVYT